MDPSRITHRTLPKDFPLPKDFINKGIKPEFHGKTPWITQLWGLNPDDPESWPESNSSTDSGKYYNPLDSHTWVHDESNSTSSDWKPPHDRNWRDKYESPSDPESNRSGPSGPWQEWTNIPQHAPFDPKSWDTIGWGR